MSETPEEISDHAREFLDEHGSYFDEVTSKFTGTGINDSQQLEEVEVIVEIPEVTVVASECPQIVLESPNKLVLWEKLSNASQSECEAVYAYLGLGPNPSKGEIWKAYLKK